MTPINKKYKKRRPSRPITVGQKRQLWWLAKRVGLEHVFRDEDLRRGWVEGATDGHCYGVSELDQWRIVQVIERLIEYGKNAINPDTGKRYLASNAQQRKIYAIAYEIGLATPSKNHNMKADTRGLRSWIYRMFRITKPVYLTFGQAKQAIEGLKKMQDRGEMYGTRRYAHNHAKV